MEKHALLSAVLCLTVVTHTRTDQTDQLDNVGVQGPVTMTKRTTRSLYNSHDCPPSWYAPRPRPPPSRPCPPGHRRPPPFGGPLPGSDTPCPPWVDSNGLCHLDDREFQGDRCRRFYGEELYSQWQRNAHLTQVAGPPGTPAPPCLPYS